MLCKNCGMEIEENSKFCGNCGTKVELINEEVSNSDNMFVVDMDKNIDFEINKPVTKNTIKPRVETVSVDLEKTLNLGTIPALNTQLLKEAKSETMSVDLEKTLNLGTVQALESKVKEYEDLNNKNNNESVVDVTTINTQMNQQSMMNSQNMVNNNFANNSNSNNNQNNEPQKNNKLPIIIGGIALGVVAILVLILAVTKTSNSTINVLEKAMNNLMTKSGNSITINTQVEVEAITGESINLSAAIKVEKTEEEAKMEVKLGKSLFTEEMSAYATVDKEKASLYIKSTTLDLLGMTYSEVPMWLSTTIDLTDTYDELESDNKNKEISLEDVIDKEHFVFVDKEENLKHYKFIIDQALVEKLKNEVADAEQREELENLEQIEKAIELDFYINNSNELCKIVFDLTPYLEVSQMKKLKFTLEFKDMNNTKVDIPKEATNSLIDIESYISAYLAGDSGFELDTGSDYELDTDFDIDYNYDLEYDYSTETSIDSFGF